MIVPAWRRQRPATDVSAVVPPDAVAIKARGVGVRLGPSEILADIDLDVTAGEVLVLVGPNGAGKSTLLSALAGDLPARRQVTLFGRDLSRWPAAVAARARAVLLQRGDVSFPFTVREVVAMGRAPWAGTDEEAADEDIVADCLAQTEVAHLHARSFDTLSGGERARVALARVLAQRTPVLMLDEPTAALDLRHQELVLTVAAERARAGVAVVVVLHDLTLAAAYADRIVLLAGASGQPGTIVADGPATDVLDSPLLSAVYGHRVEVLAHPRTGLPIVLAERAAARHGQPRDWGHAAAASS